MMLSVMTVTVQLWISFQQSACDVFNWLPGASNRQRAAFTGQSGICAFRECSGPASVLDRGK